MSYRRGTRHDSIERLRPTPLRLLPPRTISYLLGMRWYWQLRKTSPPWPVVWIADTPWVRVADFLRWYDTSAVRAMLLELDAELRARGD